ncbi:hypothetical protein SRHO_G00106000 [Serrasalmus rhombeus]
MHDLLRTLPAVKKRRWPHLPQLLFAYNTTVHQSTGHSPYELMFGRKPQLPIDALLGTVEEEMVEGIVEDWVKEQEFLHFAYASAERQLTAAAKRREPTSLQGIAPVLPSGTIVYRKNHMQGCHKVQDTWDSTLYQVVKCLDDSGRVYTIRPVEGMGPTWNLHRTELRVVPGQMVSPVDVCVLYQGASLVQKVAMKSWMTPILSTWEYRKVLGCVLEFFTVLFSIGLTQTSP